MKALAMIHETDPKQVLMDAVQPCLDGITVPPFKFIAAIYRRPEKTAGGVFLPSTAGPRKEDKYQGKVGLILKMGEGTFSSDGNHNWGSDAPKVGDWVVYNVGDTWAFMLGDTDCRWLSEEDWRLTTTNPDWFY